MALLETVTSWNEGVVAFTKGDYSGALKSFSEILDPSARILFNIACVLLKLNRSEEALQNLEACLKKDPHLAIGHYHKGMQNLKLKRHREADTDFDNAIEKMRGCPYIDYSQLGLVAKLHTYQIQSAKAINLSQRGKTREAIKLFIDASQDTDEDEFKRHAVTCIHELKTGQMLDPNELCPNCLFYPPKNLIANLKKREYVGKAKVISSYDKNENKNKNNQTDTARQGRVPPPPSRPPPNLPLKHAKSAEDLHSAALLLPKPSPKSHLRKHSADQDEAKLRPKKPQRPPLPSNLSNKSDKSLYEPLSRSMDDLFDNSLYEDATTTVQISQSKNRKSIDNEFTKALTEKFGKSHMTSPLDGKNLPSINIDDFDSENTEKDNSRLNEGQMLSKNIADVSKCKKTFKILKTSGDNLGLKTAFSTGNLESVKSSPILLLPSSKSAECLSEGKLMNSKHTSISGVTEKSFPGGKPILANVSIDAQSEKHSSDQLSDINNTCFDKNAESGTVRIPSESKLMPNTTHPFSYLVSAEPLQKQLLPKQPPKKCSTPPQRESPMLHTAATSSKQSLEICSQTPPRESSMLHTAATSSKQFPNIRSPPPKREPPMLHTAATSSKQSPKIHSSPLNKRPPLLASSTDISNQSSKLTERPQLPHKNPLKLQTAAASSSQSPKICSPPPQRKPPMMHALAAIANQSPKSPTHSPSPTRQLALMHTLAIIAKQSPKSPNRPPQPSPKNLQKLSTSPKIPSSPVLLSTTNKNIFQYQRVRLSSTYEESQSTSMSSTVHKSESPLRVKFSISEENVNQNSEIEIPEMPNMEAESEADILGHQNVLLNTSIHSPNKHLRKKEKNANKNLATGTATSPMMRQIKSMGDIGKAVTSSAKNIGTNLKTSVSSVITTVKKSPKKLNFPKTLLKNKKNKNSYSSLKRSRSADDIYSHIVEFSQRSLEDTYLEFLINDPDYVNIGQFSEKILDQSTDQDADYINTGQSDIFDQLVDGDRDYEKIEEVEEVSSIKRADNMTAIAVVDNMVANTLADNMAAISTADNMAAIFTPDNMTTITKTKNIPDIQKDAILTQQNNNPSSKDNQITAKTSDNMTSQTEIQIKENSGMVKELQKVFDSKLKKSNQN